MTEIVLNGEPTTVEEGLTVERLVSSMLPSSRGVAVAIGREVVPRSAWSEMTLTAGDEVEVVTAAAGG